MIPRPFLYLVCFFIVLYAFLWLAAFEPPLEDAFISFRCARNLWEGRGLVFNPGERVEAISNPLWTLLLAILGGTLNNYLIASKILGFLFGAGALVLVMLLVHQHTDNFWIIAVAALLLIGSPYFLTFTVYGLESPLEAFLFLALVWGLSEKRWGFAGLALGLLPWSRPEGYFFIPPVLLLLFLINRREVAWRRLLVLCLSVAGILVAFRLVYYQDWLPNTVYAKSVALVPESAVYGEKILAGLKHVFHFFLDGRFLLWLPVLVIGQLISPRCQRPMRGWAWVLMLLQTGFVIISGGNIFLRYRFLSVLYPLFCLQAGWGLAAIADRDRKRIHTGVIAALALASLIFQVEYERSGRLYWRTRLDSMQQDHDLPRFVRNRMRQMGSVPNTLNARLGFIIQDEIAPGTLIAAEQIGQIGFYGDRPIVDLVGLADWTIAHKGGTLRYLLERDPELFLLLGAQFIMDSPNVGVYAGMFGTDEFRKRYVWTRVYQSDPPTETFYWVERRPTPLQEPPRTPDEPQRIVLKLYP